MDVPETELRGVEDEPVEEQELITVTKG